MRVNVLVISYHFNFLAEAALASIPRNVYLLHVNKTQAQLNDFRTPGNATTPFPHVPHRIYHASLMEEIFSKEEYAPLFDCDAILFVDHDYIFPRNEFERISNVLTAAIARGALIAARSFICTGFDQRIFATNPMFAVKPTMPRLMGWAISRDQYGRYYDTGQHLGIGLSKTGCMALIDYAYNGIHWGSWWNWKDREARKNPNDPFLRNVVHTYADLMNKGIFRPRYCDMAIMQHYVLHQRALIAAHMIKPKSKYEHHEIWRTDESDRIG